MEQWGTAILLVSGITVFVLGEVEVSPTFNVYGIVLILVKTYFVPLSCTLCSTPFKRVCDHAGECHSMSCFANY